MSVSSTFPPSPTSFPVSHSFCDAPFNLFPSFESPPTKSRATLGNRKRGPCKSASLSLRSKKRSSPSPSRTHQPTSSSSFSFKLLTQLKSIQHPPQSVPPTLREANDGSLPAAKKLHTTHSNDDNTSTRRKDFNLLFQQYRDETNEEASESSSSSSDSDSDDSDCSLSSPPVSQNTSPEKPSSNTDVSMKPETNFDCTTSHVGLRPKFVGRGRLPPADVVIVPALQRKTQQNISRTLFIPSERRAHPAGMRSTTETSQRHLRVKRMDENREQTSERGFSDEEEEVEAGGAGEDWETEEELGVEDIPSLRVQDQDIKSGVSQFTIMLRKKKAQAQAQAHTVAHHSLMTLSHKQIVQRDRSVMPRMRLHSHTPSHFQSSSPSPSSQSRLHFQSQSHFNPGRRAVAPRFGGPASYNFRLPSNNIFGL